jgi:hypothetical protein
LAFDQTEAAMFLAIAIFAAGTLFAAAWPFVEG